MHVDTVTQRRCVGLDNGVVYNDLTIYVLFFSERT